MTQFSKSSLQRKGSNTNGTVRQLLIGVGAITAILGMINAVSSSSSSTATTTDVLVVTNPVIAGGGGGGAAAPVATIDLPKVVANPASGSAANNNKDNNNNSSNKDPVPPLLPPNMMNKEDVSKLAKKVFDEDPSDEQGNLVSQKDAAVDAKRMGEYHFNTQHELYHHYKRGLAGAVIEDILMCHAYAFHHNFTYGGSCGDSDDLMVQHKELLTSLGLGEKLPFKCPRDVKNKKDGIRRSVVQHSKCEEYNTRIWTPEYVSYLRSLVQVPETTKSNTDEQQQQQQQQHTIVVHIRRGSVTPCTRLKDGFQRYLPNLHYLNVIERYKKPDSKVLIFSQETSYESLNDFSEKGYQVSQESDLSAIWHTYVTADVAIMSRSDFSMIPSLVAQGTVVYTPMWHPPVKGWEIVDNDIMDETDAETKRLQETCS